MPSFRFVDDQPDQQLFTDIQNLNAFNDGQLSGFVGIVLSFLQHKAGTDPNDSLEAFATENKVNQKALKNTVRGVLFFFSEALKKNMSPAHVKEDLHNLGKLGSRCRTHVQTLRMYDIVTLLTNKQQQHNTTHIVTRLFLFLFCIITPFAFSYLFCVWFVLWHPSPTTTSLQVWKRIRLVF
jgi:COMMD2-7/10, HN domain